MLNMLVIVGAGGHAHTVVRLVQSLPLWSIYGVLNLKETSDRESICGARILPKATPISVLKDAGVKHFIVAVGDNEERREIFKQFVAAGLEAPTLCHPTALIDPTSHLGRGTVICAGAIIGVEVSIGENCIINTGTIIDHESLVGRNSHVAPGVCIAGQVRVGECTMIGIGSSIREKIIIGSGTIIGAGSVVTENIGDSVVAFGSPAKTVRPRS